MIKEIVKLLLDLIEANAGEIGSAAITALIALLKRWLDIRRIRDKVRAAGISEDQVNKIV